MFCHVYEQTIPHPHIFTCGVDTFSMDKTMVCIYIVRKTYMGNCATLTI